MQRKRTTGRIPSRKRTAVSPAAVAAGAAGLLLAAWLVYGTASADPFRWDVFVEELIVALCALFALRLLCVIRLPQWVSIASIALVPAGIILAGAANPAAMPRALSLAAACAFALLAARELDTRPDGVLVTALLCAACAPVLLAVQTRLMDELMRALIMAGVYLAVLAARKKTVQLAYLSAAAFALAGSAGLYAAFAGLGAGVGLLLLAPKRSRGGWTLAAVLMTALPVAALFAAKVLLPQESALFSVNPQFAGAFAGLIRTHLLRALALGLLLMALRFFLNREDAAVPVVLALAGCALARLLPFVHAPEVWMDLLPLSVLAGIGTAKAARNAGR